MERVLPTLQQFKAEAKTLKKKTASIKNHSQALNHLAQHYGYRNFQTIRPYLPTEDTNKSIVDAGALRWENPFKSALSNSSTITIKSKGIKERTLEVYKSMDWNKLKNTKVVLEAPGNQSGAIATLDIRGKEIELLFYDYYLLIAIELSDAFDVDFDFVYDLRTAIREDINHFVGPLLDTLYSYPSYNLKALRLFNEFYDGYHNDESSDFFEIEPYIDRLEDILRKVNNT